MIFIDRLKEQIEVSKQFSDSEFFMSLLKIGEFITKLTTLVLVASLEENKERLKLKYTYDAISSDGIGGWVMVIEQILKTAVVFKISEDFTGIKNDLLMKRTPNEWGYDALIGIYKSKHIIDGLPIDYNIKIYLRDWFKKFAEIRNDHAHNRIPIHKYPQIVSEFEKSINLIINNFYLFKYRWVYNGKSPNGQSLPIKLSTNQNEINFINDDKEGIYLITENNRKFIIPFFITNISLFDFYVPNGKYSDKSF